MTKMPIVIADGEEREGMSVTAIGIGDFIRLTTGKCYQKECSRGIPYNKIIKRGRAGSSRVMCDKCHKIKRIKYMARIKGKILCSNCKNIIKA